VQPLQWFIESLAVKFWHIKQYELDSGWRLRQRQLQHEVLWFVQEGRFSLRVNGDSYTGRAGCAYLLPANSEIDGYAITDRIVLTSINFDAAVTLLSGRSWTALLQLPVMLEDTGRELEPLFTEMLSQASQPGLGQPLLLQSGLLRILSVLLDKGVYVPPESEARTPGMDRRLQTVVDYLLCHPEELPEISGLAQLADVSESHLRKLFLKDTGLSPLAFVHQLKVEQAKKLLVLGDGRVSDVAFQLGFADANYFTRLFKAKTGFSPLQYRKQYRLWTHDGENEQE
jgi:AraC-like DNA-binding protein